ncbi:MAG: hypothetical protein E6H00_08775 [Bacillati bacterium ANGP1]|uniref:PaaI family thioesterase n=1 Tax=Candidatus Segetimicrobium genomatis TaxID=2569760 RepID=A0A537K230_9BACT|nr:MAG: hypothetical protein E6H00_08775 [Terrabacteria group bacterium ANGP1]
MREAEERFAHREPSRRKREDLIDQQPGQRNYRCQCANHSIRGWHLTSYLSSEENVCTWEPRAIGGGAQEGLDGLTITDLIASHSIGAAMAAAQQASGRPLGAEPAFQYAATSLRITILGPPLIRAALTLRGRVRALQAEHVTVICSLFTGEKEYARSEVVVVRTPTNAH